MLIIKFGFFSIGFRSDFATVCIFQSVETWHALSPINIEALKHYIIEALFTTQ